MRSCIFCSSSMHLTKHLVVWLCRWETCFPRKAFRFRCPPGEGRMQFNERTCSKIQSWMRQVGDKPIYHKVVLQVFKSAWRETLPWEGLASNLLADCRAFCNHTWWEAIKICKDHGLNTSWFTLATATERNGKMYFAMCFVRLGARYAIGAVQ